nr:DinB family protein [Armatimonas sp.]
MNPYIQRYILSGLRATPQVYTKLLDGIAEEEADRRPDPERFTIREAIAHMADWDEIFRVRGERIRDEEVPLLPGYDEGQLAVERNYAAMPVTESLERLIQSRAALLAFFESLQPTDWERQGNRDEIGMINLSDLSIMVLGHDGYHAEQFIRYRNAA